MSDAGVVRETRQVLAELKCGKCQLQVAVGEAACVNFPGEPRRSGGRFLFVLLPGKGKWVGAKLPYLALHGWPTKRGYSRFAGL